MKIPANYKKLLKIAFTVIIGVLLIYFLYNNREDLYVFLTISWKFILLISFAKILVQLTNSFFLKVTLKVFDKDMPVSDSTEITFLSTLTNNLTPFRGGAGVRAVYLKENFALNYKSFVTVLLGNYVVIFLISTFLGLIALLFFLNDPDVRQFQLYIIIGFFIAIIVLMLILIFFDMDKVLKFIPEKWRLSKYFKSTLIKINSGWKKIVGRKDILLSLIMISILNYILVMLVFYLELRSIGIFVPIKSLMVYTSLSAISLLISLTPGSLGVKEVILLFGQDLLGLEASQIVGISIFDRTLTLAVVIVGFFTIVGMKKLAGVYSAQKKRKI